jgi:ketosteroid isomerase-like protein
VGFGAHGSPRFAVSWQPTKAEASRGGDIGYTLGTYELTLNNPQGTPVTDRGKYLTVWKKQADGSWKVAVDTFNSDLPAEGGTAH